MPVIPANPSAFTMSFSADSTIYENTVRCRINENDFNYSQNPSLLKYALEQVTYSLDASAISYNTFSSTIPSGLAVLKIIRTNFASTSQFPFDVTINYTVKFSTTIIGDVSITSSVVLPARQNSVTDYIPYNTNIITGYYPTTIVATYTQLELLNSTMKDFATGSEFRPYATTVGLYNDADELLLVGKLSTPYPIPSNTDVTFIVRWDS